MSTISNSQEDKGPSRRGSVLSPNAALSVPNTAPATTLPSRKSLRGGISALAEDDTSLLDKEKSIHSLSLSDKNESSSIPRRRSSHSSYIFPPTRPLDQIPGLDNSSTYNPYHKSTDTIKSREFSSSHSEQPISEGGRNNQLPPLSFKDASPVNRSPLGGTPGNLSPLVGRAQKGASSPLREATGAISPLQSHGNETSSPLQSRETNQSYGNAVSPIQSRETNQSNGYGVSPLLSQYNDPASPLQSREINASQLNGAVSPLLSHGNGAITPLQSHGNGAVSPLMSHGNGAITPLQSRGNETIQSRETTRQKFTEIARPPTFGEKDQGPERKITYKEVARRATESKVEYEVARKTTTR